MYANQTFSDMFMTPYELNARMAEEQVRHGSVSGDAFKGVF